MKFSINNTKAALGASALVGFSLVLAGCNSAPPTTPIAKTDNTPAVADSSSQSTSPATKPDTDKTSAPAAQDAVVNSKKIVWMSSYNKALQKASAENKPVMIDFYADWCTACHYLDKNIYTNSTVIQESHKFVNLRIDTDKQTDIAQRYKVTNLPTLLFMDGNGKVLWRLEGAPRQSSYFVSTMKKAHQKFVTG